MILGYSGYGYKQSADPTPTLINDITSVKETNSINDYLYITQDVSKTLVPSMVSDWDFNTVLVANYNGNLLAGNVDFLISQINSVRIKYREIGTNKWVTLEDVPITNADDLSFIRFNKYMKGNNTEYQVALIPMMANNVEGNYNTNTIKSNFNGLFVMDKNNSYHMISQVISPTHVIKTSILEPIESKYPIVIHNAKTDYKKMSIKGMFIQTVDNNYDKEGAYIYRENALSFLKNGYAKIIKDDVGRIYLIDICDSPSNDESNITAQGYTLTTFTVCEIGDAMSTEDLYENGLIDNIDVSNGY
jgi:predicted small secreted protein